MTEIHQSCIAIDFETSGYYQHSACAIGMARVEDGTIKDQFYSLIKPPSQRIYFTHVHGLTWRDLKTAPTFNELWPEILAFTAGASFFLAHNAPFDRRVLAACCTNFDVALPALPFLCTLKGSRKILKIPHKSLSDLCEYFHIQLKHHHAGSDAQGCALIFLELLKLGLTEKDMLLF